MISFTKDSNAIQTVRVIGVGNAGVRLADAVTMRGTRGVEVIAMNTDARSLAASVVQRKAALGERVARGLGAGGDPEIGHEAALESRDEIRYAIDGASIVILLGGLGGGTATGVLPVIAQRAQEKNVFVIALVTEPFEFEGRRRVTQAQYAKKALAAHCDIMLSFENGRMSELTSPRESVEETFAVADAMLADCVASLAEILAGRGPMPVDLLGISRSFSPGALPFFGRGESASKNRASEALERALRGPLVATRALQEATTVVIHIAGPESLSFLETVAIMQEIGRYFSENVKFFMGVSTDTSESLRLTLLGTSTASATAARPTRPVAPSVPNDAGMVSIQSTLINSTESIASTESPPSTALPRQEVAQDETTISLEPPRPPGRLLGATAATPGEPEPELLSPSMLDEVSVDKPKTKRTPSKNEQTVLQFDSVRSARFDKSVPTIIDGEDLDKPAFMRVKNL